VGLPERASWFPLVTLSTPTQGWESIWADLDALPDYWRTPDQTVLAWAERLREAGGRQVLDLGCGIGRHTLLLARLGLAVAATDVAHSGLVTCAAWLAREGLSASLARHEMETFPFRDGTFDGLISYHVIYHTTVAGLRRILDHVRRVLRPGGWLYLTANARDERKMAAYRADAAAGKCQEIEPFTFIYLHDAPDDKHLPHHYCDEAELRDLLTGFAVDDLRLVHKEYADEDGGAVRRSTHYHVQCRRL
jgi:SAM-dependent methyltransferase